jgi:apolipoprotein D and lipocalin family protein
VVANIPFSGEENYAGSIEIWALREDGRIDDSVLGRRFGFNQPETGGTLLATPVRGSIERPIVTYGAQHKP